jgi:hypothetical protein
MKKIVMRTQNQVFEIDLNDSDTANAIWLALPFEAYVNVWGEEIYFEIPVEMPIENGRTLMKIGEVAFWPNGSALCFFFGPTPVSADGTPTAVSDVSPVGMVLGDAKELKKVGDRIRVSLIKG